MEDLPRIDGSSSRTHSTLLTRKWHRGGWGRLGSKPEGLVHLFRDPRDPRETSELHPSIHPSGKGRTILSILEFQLHRSDPKAHVRKHDIGTHGISWQRHDRNLRRRGSDPTRRLSHPTAKGR